MRLKFLLLASTLVMMLSGCSQMTTISTSSYVDVDGPCGIELEVPEYMRASDRNSDGNYDWFASDEKIRYVYVQVSGDAWPDELKDISDITVDDVVWEDMTKHDDTFMLTGHYFFTTDKTNIGEHEIQVLFGVHADSERAAEMEAKHVAETLDFSNFYFDRFAE